MDDKVLEELRIHQESVTKDSSSPLHLIREKELEISGRVLAARKDAEEIVSVARRKAVETTASAQEDAEKLAAEREKEVLVEVDSEIQRLREETETAAAELERVIQDERKKAVEFLVDSVTRM